MITDHFYRLRQEDAAEALTQHFLDGDKCPTLSRHTWTLGSQSLRCEHCGRTKQPSQVRFNAFDVPIEVEGSPGNTLLLHDVQSAFDEYLENDPVQYTDEPCAHCNSVRFLKTFRAVAFPEVLVLRLNRFKFLEVEPPTTPRTFTGPHGINHPVEATQVLDFQGNTYDLCSAVVHLGESVHSGHYITLAKHSTSNGLWWLYDDGERREAKPAQLSTTTLYERSLDLMKSYVLFYEKRNQT